MQCTKVITVKVNKKKRMNIAKFIKTYTNIFIYTYIICDKIDSK